MDTSNDIRPGEVGFPADPAGADDSRLCFIGRIRSPWRTRADCPKNVRIARERGEGAAIEIDEPFRLALTGLAAGQGLHVLSWLGDARRDLALQMPKHAEAPRGTFSLRSPVRPNPIGLHLVRITAIDIAAGRIEIDAIDTLDGTAVLDLKPYFESVDLLPAAGHATDTSTVGASVADDHAGAAALLSAADHAETQ